jgi:hypothetical protein
MELFGYGNRIKLEDKKHGFIQIDLNSEKFWINDTLENVYIYFNSLMSKNKNKLEKKDIKLMIWD